MKKEGMSFPDAVRSLARRFGVVIKEEKSGASDLKAAICGANGFAREYFRMALAAPSNKRAMDYLAKRGYSDPALLERFSVGFAPDKWDGLIGFLRKKGVSMDLAEKAGLVVKKDGGGYYARFRGRVM
ncbi:MAG: DNA primase, partial [Deltaproteobacteria bacterium]